MAEMSQILLLTNLDSAPLETGSVSLEYWTWATCKFKATGSCLGESPALQGANAESQSQREKSTALTQTEKQETSYGRGTILSEKETETDIGRIQKILSNRKNLVPLAFLFWKAAFPISESHKMLMYPSPKAPILLKLS